MPRLPRNTILLGDAAERLEHIPAGSIDCVITSPPFYQLRDYGVAGQIGLEPTVDGWVARIRGVMRAVARVLKASGSVWLDLGDSYSRHREYGASPKSLLLAPERLLLVLARDGWIVRNKVIWAKANPMPTSVTDRLNTTYDVVYFLVRSRQYFFDLDAIREPHRSSGGRGPRKTAETTDWMAPLASNRRGLARARQEPGHPLGKNPGDVWRIATASFRGPHFAAFPPKLAERPLLATCPARICSACGKPWRTRSRLRVIGPTTDIDRDIRIRRYPTSYRKVRERPRLVAECACGVATKPGVVLDPFFGTGTVGAVAQAHRRDWLGIEINPKFVKLAEDRLGQNSIQSVEAAA